MTETAAPGGPQAGNRSCLKWGAIGCVVVLVVGVLGGGTILMVVLGAVKRSDAYRGAVERARAHPAVVEALGEPIETGFFVSGSVEVSGPGGQASLSIPLEGPNGEGTLFVEADKRAGIWEYSLLRFIPDGAESRIDLLRTSPEPAARPAAAGQAPVSATPAGDATIDRIAFSTDADGEEIRDRFPSGVTLVVAGVHYANLGPEDEIVRRWYLDGEKVDEQFATVAEMARGEAIPATGWLTARLSNPDGLESGEYRLDIWLNGTRAQSGTFVVE